MSREVEELALRAQELSERALQEAIDALARARRGLLTPTRIEELELMVARARTMLARAKQSHEIASGVAERAKAQRVDLTAERASREQRMTRPWAPRLVTSGSRTVVCTACGATVEITFRSSTPAPVSTVQVRCPAAGCSRALQCMAPTSAYAFKAVAR